MKRLLIGLVLVVVPGVVCPALPAAAADPVVRTWDGGGSDNKWATPANWVGDTAPRAGDILVFPGSAAVRITHNDFAAGTAFTAIRVVWDGSGSNGYSMSGTEVIVTEEITNELYGTVLGVPLVLGGDVVVHNTATWFSFSSPRLQQHQIVFTGSGTTGVSNFFGEPDPDVGVVVDMDEGGVLQVEGGSNDFTGATLVIGGTLRQHSPTWRGPVYLDGGAIDGGYNGELGDVFGLEGGGRFALAGAHMGTLDLDPSTEFAGPASVWVTGDVALNGATLDLGREWCGACHWGQNTELVFNDGTDAVVGTFAGLPDGARWEVDGVYFEIDYTGGDGNDIYVRVVDSLTEAPSSPPPPPPTPMRSGYWMVGEKGTVYAYGDARRFGSASIGAARAVDIEATPDFNGYWIIDHLGHVFTFGNAPYLGGAPPLPVGETVVSLSGTKSGRGYWLFTNRGRAMPFGDAPRLPDMYGKPLNGPVLDSIRTASGLGYYMVASDGGVFTFGDAQFHGSMGGRPLNAPVRSLVPDPDGTGYWLVAGDGGVFSFRADFRGSMGGKPLNKPMVGMVPYGNGYLMVAADGGIFNFSDKPFLGSLGANPPPTPIVSVAALNG